MKVRRPLYWTSFSSFVAAWYRSPHWSPGWSLGYWLTLAAQQLIAREPPFLLPLVRAAAALTDLTLQNQMPRGQVSGRRLLPIAQRMPPARLDCPAPVNCRIPILAIRGSRFHVVDPAQSEQGKQRQLVPLFEQNPNLLQRFRLFCSPRHHSRQLKKPSAQSEEPRARSGSRQPAEESDSRMAKSCHSYYLQSCSKTVKSPLQ